MVTAATLELVLFAVVLALLSSHPAASAARTSKPELAARLRLNGESPISCSESLFQLQSCTGEVVMFFLNGETYLGPRCCRAIRTVQHDCWADLLGALGYTTEEGDALEGHCDAAVHESTMHLPLSPEA